MDNEEPIYDFMAAAEETGRQLDAMVKRLPGDIVTVLQQQWQQSPWRTELPAAVTRTTEAAREAEAAAEVLQKRAVRTAWLVGLAAIVIPVVLCILAYLNLSDVRRDEEATRKRIQVLEGQESRLKAAMGGGAEFYQQDGMCYFIPPHGVSAFEPVKFKDGRNGVKYSVAE